MPGRRGFAVSTTRVTPTRLPRNGLALDQKFFDLTCAADVTKIGFAGAALE